MGRTSPFVKTMSRMIKCMRKEGYGIQTFSLFKIKPLCKYIEEKYDQIESP